MTGLDDLIRQRHDLDCRIRALRTGRSPEPDPAPDDSGAAPAIAREIISRRAAIGEIPVTDVSRRDYQAGLCAGLRLALSHVIGQPGNIGADGAEGYVHGVERAGEAAAGERGAAGGS